MDRKTHDSFFEAMDQRTSKDPFVTVPLGQREVNDLSSGKTVEAPLTLEIPSTDGSKPTKVSFAVFLSMVGKKRKRRKDSGKIREAKAKKSAKKSSAKKAGEVPVTKDEPPSKEATT